MIIKFLSKNFYISFSIVALIYFLDRFSKIYVIQLVKNNLGSDIFNSAYLNIVLIWNKGIAFGLLSFDKVFIYNAITSIIAGINIVILVMIIKNKGFKKHSLLLVLGGSLGNMFDRIYYTAVPDFIDFHINNFHWFVFNVADIFITMGIILLILDELFFNNKKNENNV